MTLHELKIPYETIYLTVPATILNMSSEELIDVLPDKSFDTDAIMSVLIYRSWQALVNIFYKQKSLTEEQCYDIYLEALEYIIKTKPWKKEDNILYNDSNAFLKAMITCTKSRKMNYFISQHRDKRLLNTTALSIDKLSEEYNDYYQGFDTDTYFPELLNITSEIKKLFCSKKYITAFVLDAILNSDVFSENGIDLKKMRKHLIRLTENYLKTFATKYSVNFEEAIYSKKYFIHLQPAKFNDKIIHALDDIKLIFTEKEYVS